MMTSEPERKPPGENPDDDCSEYAVAMNGFIREIISYNA